LQAEPAPDDSAASARKNDAPPHAELPEAAPLPVPAPLPAGGRLSLVLYSVTIFLSAFLLFQIQPLIGKFILPWFGGTPGVWTTCMLVFQVLLFGGYAYAHLTVSRLSSRAQGILHVVLLLAACLALPVIPSLALKPQGEVEPISRIVVLLGATVGLPFFVLSATGPLLQGWFSRTHPGRSPYRLYALSNVGSLLALVSFPAVFDWSLATKALAYLWSASFGVFALLCAVCAVNAARRARLATAPILGAVEESLSDTTPPSFGTKLLWFGLAMVPSVLLLATTNQVCLDVASVPFLWVLPLTLYLLSFILCFDSDWWYSRKIMMPAALLALVALYPVLRTGATASFAVQLLAYFIAFFLCAMVCHGELVRRKPDARHLTAFYLVIAAGGAAGGIFVGIIAPLVFNNYYELHLGLFAAAALMLVVVGTDKQSWFYRGHPRFVWLVLVLALIGYGVALVDEARQKDRSLVDIRRTFYGVLRVTSDEEEYDKQDEPVLRLMNGRISHGFQYTNPELHAVATTYYSPESGVGLLLHDRPANQVRRVGLVGLGTGTLATYARPGDHFQFYDINPAVERIARHYFHYLTECRGTVEVFLGDARLTLDRQLPQKFDVLALDAFSGDAIPIHLLTVEAFAIYLRHLAPHGVIAVHISNRHFDLEPVVIAIAEHSRLSAVTIQADDTSFGGYSSTWVLVSPDPDRLKDDVIKKAADDDDDGSRVLWTDDHASLAQVLWHKTFETLWSNLRDLTSKVHDEIFGAKENETPE
jgi:spermidine synthase